MCASQGCILNETPCTDTLWKIYPKHNIMKTYRRRGDLSRHNVTSGGYFKFWPINPLEKGTRQIQQAFGSIPPRSSLQPVEQTRSCHNRKQYPEGQNHSQTQIYSCSMLKYKISPFAHRHILLTLLHPLLILKQEEN
jgi:hypothetical protein